MKKIALIVVFLFFLVSSVSAQPFQSSTGTAGLEIEAQTLTYMKQNRDVRVHAHAINTSNGVIMTNATTSCRFHLFNLTGYELVDVMMDYDATHLDYHKDIGGENFSQIGIHAYSIFCNTSSSGGFISGNFQVTADGLQTTNDNSSGIALVIFMLFGAGLFLLLPIIKKPLSKNIFVDVILRRGSWIIGIFLMSLNTVMVATIAAESFLPLTGEFLFGYMWLFNWGGYLLMFFTFFKTFLDLLSMWKIRKSEERYGDE